MQQLCTFGIISFIRHENYDRVCYCSIVSVIFSDKKVDPPHV